jgi:hypothetical protein
MDDQGDDQSLEEYAKRIVFAAKSVSKIKPLTLLNASGFRFILYLSYCVLSTTN